jgi:hypothetical protein
MFILSILTLLVALLAFLIDVLLFVPHMAWGSYIVLAATVLIAASGIVSCAMRRTLVSRKARKRRIAENAEMNGENFYNRQNATDTTPAVESAAPMVNGAPGADKLPSFATFEMNKQNSDRTSDERVPLTARSPTDSIPGDANGAIGMTERFAGPQGMGGAPLGAMNNGFNGPPRDQYGNPIPGAAYGPNQSRDPSREPGLRSQYSDGSLNSRGRGVYRGRGGYPQNGRGGYGPPNGRGGYGPPQGRGGYGPGPGPRGGLMGPIAGAAGGAMAGRGGRGPPPGYYNGYGGPPGGRGGYGRAPSPAGSYGPYGRRPSNESSASAYNRNPSPGPGGFVAYPGGNTQSMTSSLPRAESPPPLPGVDEGPVGQAVEMDATTGSPPIPAAGFGNFGGIRDSDGDVAGMVGLQQGISPRPGPQRHETIMSETSRYSTDE